MLLQVVREDKKRHVAFGATCPPYLLYIMYIVCRLLFLGLFHDVLASGEVSCRSSHEDRRQRTEDDTQNHCEGETADAGTAKAEDDCKYDERRYRGVDGTVQCAVQRLVEEFLLVTLRVQVEELADAVEDNHLVVD